MFTSNLDASRIKEMYDKATFFMLVVVNFEIQILSFFWGIQNQAEVALCLFTKKLYINNEVANPGKVLSVGTLYTLFLEVSIQFARVE